MYVSGNIADFSSRLHKLPTGQSDLDTFKLEGSLYTGIIGPKTGVTGARFSNVFKKWDKEYNLSQYQFSNSGAFLTGKPFTL